MKIIIFAFMFYSIKISILLKSLYLKIMLLEMILIKRKKIQVGLLKNL
jgi:hypothetical protein